MGVVGVRDNFQEVTSKLNLNCLKERPNKIPAVVKAEESMVRQGKSGQGMYVGGNSEQFRTVESGGWSREGMKSKGREGYKGHV